MTQGNSAIQPQPQSITTKISVEDAMILAQMMSNYLTEDIVKRVTKEVLSQVEEKHVCRYDIPEDQFNTDMRDLHDFISVWKEARSIVLKVVLSFAVLAILGWMAIGFYHNVAKGIPKQ